VRLLDSDVMIDILREYLPALRWLHTVVNEEFGLPGIVVLQLMEGCKDKRAMQRLQKRIGPYRVYWPTARDCDRALAAFSRTRLSHRIDLTDVLIGECAVGLGVPLCTFNVRHFRAVAGLTTAQPYARV
jgi:predicted nucleic acid-binding protein